MPCYHPKIAQQSQKGARLSFKSFSAGEPFLTIPCGQCMGCRVMRSRSWAVRCMGEVQTSGVGLSWFATFTYAPEHNPITLVPRDHTLLMKRIRKEYPGVRFFMCGEYGDQKNPVTGFGRPHFHYLFFGMDLPDRKLYASSGGHPLFISDNLAEIWGKGFVTVGPATLESAQYVAGYVHKKRVGKDAEQFYSVTHPETGKAFRMHPEFGRMSLKPGIGSEWFAKYYRDVYPADKVTLKGGAVVRPPPFFDVLYERLANQDSSLPPLDELKEKRRQRALVTADDATDARLKVREACAAARAAFYSRKKL